MTALHSQHPFTLMIQQLTGIDLPTLAYELALLYPEEAFRGATVAFRQKSDLQNVVMTIAEAVTHAYKHIIHTTPEDLLGRSRSQKLTELRSTLVDLLHRPDVADMTYQEIGRALGQRDHTTILYYVEHASRNSFAYQEVFNRVYPLFQRENNDTDTTVDKP